MPYQRRERSSGDLYHVIIRGSGRRLIFEDSADERNLTERLADGLAENSVDLYAWCLMSNHAHFILRGKMENIARLMEELEKSYVTYFNHRHDCVGHLFQGRYRSVAIKSDAQLMETVRYVHRNPVEAGVSEMQSYPWCSYCEYVNSPKITVTDPVLAIIGGVTEFERFHLELPDERSLAPCPMAASRISEAAAIEILAHALETEGVHEVPLADKPGRDRIIVLLRRKGLSIRQIERLTGIGRNIVSRAK